MVVRTTLEYRGYEEKEWNVNGSRGITRLASFLDPLSLMVYKLDVAEDYAAEFKALNLEPRREYDVTLSMTAQQQITNDTSYGRDRFVVSSRNFICRFEIKEVCPFSNTVLPQDVDAAAARAARRDAAIDMSGNVSGTEVSGKKGGK